MKQHKTTEITRIKAKQSETTQNNAKQHETTQNYTKTEINGYATLSINSPCLITTKCQ
jgi:hypothetical protein